MFLLLLLKKVIKIDLKHEQRREEKKVAYFNIDVISIAGLRQKKIIFFLFIYLALLW